MGNHAHIDQVAEQWMAFVVGILPAATYLLPQQFTASRNAFGDGLDISRAVRVPHLELRIAHKLVFWVLWSWKPVGNMQRPLEAEVLPHFCTFPGQNGAETGHFRSVNASKSECEVAGPFHLYARMMPSDESRAR